MRGPIENYDRQKPSYLWHPFVPFGVPTVFQGQAGYGKTTIISKIAAELSHGVYPPRLRHGTIKGRGELTEWQSEAIAYMLNNVPEDDVDDSEIERVLFNGMELDGVDEEDDEAEKAEVPPMDRPFMRPVGDPIKTVYISRENHYGNVIRAKYEEFGGRPGYLSVEDESDGLFTTAVEKIRDLTGDAKLVIIDPIFPFIEGQLSNNDDVAHAMGYGDRPYPLFLIFGIISIHHLRITFLPWMRRKDKSTKTNNVQWFSMSFSRAANRRRLRGIRCFITSVPPATGSC